MSGRGPSPSSGDAVAWPLPAAFPSRYGAPVLTAVDTEIFRHRYFTDCMACGFCEDQCCSWGVDVDLVHVTNLTEHAASLEAYTGIPRGRWFRAGVLRDPEMPGGGSVRTRVSGGRCVFRNPQGRGCLIHSFALERGLDYHDLKPIVDCLFPLTFSGGTLTTTVEVDERSLICLDTGPTLYRGVRDELGYYFGAGLVETLDELESQGLRDAPGSATAAV